jgi:drug/metabolite transporter (DMT)-like permease
VPAPAKSLKGPILVLILLSLIWGYSWPVVKIGLAYAPVLEFAAIRTAIGAAGLLIYLGFFSSSPFRPVAWTPILVLSALMTTGFSILSVLPVLTGGAGKTSVLVFTMPFWLVPSPPVQWTWQFVAGISFLGLFSNALGWVLWMYVLQRLPAGIAGLSTMAIPAIAVIASWLQLGERPLRLELGGMVLIVAALAMLGALGLQERKAATPVASEECQG